MRWTPRIVASALLMLAAAGCAPWNCGHARSHSGGEPYAARGSGEGFLDPWFGFFDPWCFGFGDGPPNEWYAGGSTHGTCDPSCATVWGYDNCVDPTYGFATPGFGHPSGPAGTAPPAGGPGFPGSSKPHGGGSPTPSPMPQPMPPLAAPMPIPTGPPHPEPMVTPVPTPHPVEPPSRRPMSTPLPGTVPVESNPASSVPPAALLAPEPFPAQDTRHISPWTPRRS